MDRVGTAVIGAGQAGLAIGYYLRQADEDFVILDGHERVGDCWRERYDSLRLFSRPRYASLPGLRIGTRDCPSRDEMADYLEQYAVHHELPVRSGVRVTRLSRDDDGFLVETTAGDWRADQVVVAAGMHSVPRWPAFAGELDASIRQLHSLEYRNPEQFADGTVLVVGAANSGTDIALEAVKTHRTLLAGRHPGQVPIDIDSTVGQVFTPVVMFLFKYVLTRRTPMGRKAIANAVKSGLPLTRNKLEHLDAAGIERIGRIVGVRDGKPVTADGDVLDDVRTVVWSTGSDPDHGWIDLPVFDDDGRPRHTRGVAEDVPGLYFLGLDFQYAIASASIQGVDRDARFLVKHLAGRSTHRAISVDRR
ncbi:putative flavoprotein involved in K+ transport [Kribbella sp. VKM Ac-2571]|uniref:flavin-containing monooxygenase n=1 Tax=Kribbella sp. VKM Ac-2571 TaxID=2512222 RepID=UPI0010608802|nr:NAD(P)/FAD-dependent oxidoreductase [Kribbella sp. VKM Ac-2571]TDO55377.1 putative flavoprotein involved in K+ transport [Kribbella sp. VKM Ac-2571]